MNLQQLGVQLIWTIGQVTVVLSVGVILYLAVRRRGPAMRSLFAGATLAIALAMALLVLSPWPRWYNVSLAPVGTVSADSDEEAGKVVDEAKPQAAGGPDFQEATSNGESQPQRRATRLENRTRAAVSAFWQALHDNLSTPAGYTATPARRDWQWPSVLAVIFLTGMALAVVRLLVGMWAVASYRRRAAPIRDASLLAEVAELQGRIGCRRDVTVCESGAVGAPATIGWRRPLVLLPADWREWNAADRRAVLAHEVAHVARGDYLSGLIARLATALHFYHPLAHWLARRMRFEQELAADACGVACSGGKESYVVALARMALAQDNRALAWAARPFLPNRSTFLRRIEMLRNTSRLDQAPFRPATRRLALAGLVAVALLIAGLRGPIVLSGREAEAQQPGAAAAAGNFDLKGVPEETVVYAVIRPASILAGDANLKNMIATMEKEMNLRENAGISPSEVEEFRLMAVNLTVPGQALSIEPVMVVRTTRPEGWKSLADQWKDAVQAEYRGQKYSRSEHAGRGPSAGWSSFVADEHTLVFSPREQALKAYIDAVKGGGAAPRWAGEFKRVEGLAAALAVDVKFFASLWEAELNKDLGRQHGGPDSAVMLAIAPIWRQTNTLVAGAKLNGKIQLEAHAIAKSEQGADEVAATTSAIKTLAQNMLPVIRRQPSGGPEFAELAKLKSDLLDQAEKFLAQVKPTREGNVVSVRIEGTEAFGPMTAGLLLPALAKAREAAQRAQSINNLKQIAIAMHNYHDVYKHLPAASILGPDGKTPHSWRVAILPFIEQQDVYSQYKFDEPWDSENNLKLLDKMPAVYRSPSAGPGNSSSYYVVTGKGGLFSEGSAKKGAEITQIRDGTSNTLMAVEAKRDIPWTKPEDIPYDVDGALPKLGGFAREGFAAAIADGSVRFIAKGMDPKVFKAIFTASGGEAVSPDQLNPPGARNVPQGPQRPAAIAPPQPADRRR